MPSNLFIFFYQGRRRDHWHCMFFFFAFFTYGACFLSVSITIAMAPVQQQNKKYDLKFKLSVVKYAEENSEEAAARCLSEEDSSRARLPAGGRKKAREEPEINMREWVISKRADSVPQNDHGDGETNVRHHEWQMRSLQRVLFGWIISSDTTTGFLWGRN